MKRDSTIDRYGRLAGSQDNLHLIQCPEPGGGAAMHFKCKRRTQA